MSKASNPTRPAATTEEVGHRLDALSAKQRRRLTDCGYSIADLRRVSEVEKQADAVDALLAIMLDRQGYVHDQGDLKAAQRVAHTLDAKMDPKSWLIHRKKEQPTMAVTRPSKPASWGMIAGIIGGFFALLFIVAALVVATR